MRFVAVIAGMLCCAALAPADPSIRLKSRTIDVSTPRVAALGHHFLLQFAGAPGPELRAELARRGMRVLGPVPDSALMVSSAGPPDLSGLDITWAGPLAAGDKISPELARSRQTVYLVIFHSDVPAAAAREIVGRHGFSVLPHQDLLPNHLLVLASPRRLRSLAGLDEVAYILPASPDLLGGQRVIGCAGPLTEAGLVGPYVEVSPGWARSGDGRVDLHYAFQSLTPKIEQNAERNEVARALSEWERYTNLDFSATDDVVADRTITILFARGLHGDSYPFDGRGRMLAHTFYPQPPNREPIAGDMHLDADENWAIGGGIDLFSVALHEAGHALGLGHTDRPGSVMYPYYRLLTGLSDDDIAGIRELYGSNGAPPAEPRTPAVPAPPPPQPTQPPAPPAPERPKADATPP
ncbi:MAG TPA: matrixin family metalloprotease, partial [Bryobacteraceae bacterium]|nr:matrixin family metalloprotease [Bryobacteraceae bacterium]